MNPREFCQKRGYGNALLFTYSFDALFFERVVLHDLRIGESRDILVLADHRALRDAAPRWPGQIHDLGRRYLLGEVRLNGAFHPKVFLRLGKTGGLAWIGSGNLTSGGWGGNRELASAWRVGPDAEDPGTWIPGFLQELLALVPDGLVQSTVERMIDLPWLDLRTPARQTSSVAFGGLQQTLASQLEERWRGRRFTKLTVLTGSTDSDGAMLKWAHDTFGVRQVRLICPGGTSQLDPRRVARLPLKLTICGLPGRPVHGKFYWFEGDGPAAAVAGSANCSGAAWLRTPAQNGNVEAVVVCDKATKADFSGVLDDLRESVEVDVRDRIPEIAEAHLPPEPDYELTSVRYDGGTLEIAATFSRAIPKKVVVRIEFSRAVVRLRPRSDDTATWTGLADAPLLLLGAEFATAVVVQQGRTIRTPGRWVDVVDDLRSQKFASYGAPLERLAAASGPGDESSLLHDIHLVAEALLGDTGDFPDPPVRLRLPKDGQTTSRDTTAVDPNVFVRSIEDLRVHFHRDPTSSLTHRLSVYGIMGALFGVAATSEQGTESQFEEEEQPPENSSQAPVDSLRDRGAPPRPQSGLSQRGLDRLAKQLDDFLERFSNPDFLESCTASQFVQAAAFPLAIAALGRPSDEFGKGWDGWCAKWVQTVFDALFTIKLRGHEQRGMLAALQDRFQRENKQTIFERVVGDGTLWVALLSSLGATKLSGLLRPFEKALALREVFQREALLGHADAGRLRILVERVLTPRTHETLARQAPKVTALLERLEQHLLAGFDELRDQQPCQALKHSVGDLIWSPNGGWGAIQSDAPISRGSRVDVRFHKRGETVEAIAAGYFVNVTKAAATDAEITRLLDEIRRTVE